MFEILSFGDKGYGDELLRGALLTVELALASLALGIVLGLATAAAMNSKSRIGRWIAGIYTTIVRGLPEFLVVLGVYYGGEAGINALLGLVGFSSGIEISKFLAGTMALALIFGAYSGELFRGAFLAVPAGQIEAGIAAGMSHRQVFVRVRLPQMWRFAIPGLGNLWMVLLKDTSLISVIALDELLRETSTAAENTGQPFTFFLAATVIYLLLTIVSDIFRQRLERRANRGVVRALG